MDPTQKITPIGFDPYRERVSLSAAPEYIWNIFTHRNNAVHETRGYKWKLHLDKPNQSFMKKSFSYRRASAWNKHGVAPYWGPGDPVPGAHFQGKGEVQRLLPAKLHCIRLQNIKQTHHIFMFESFKGKGDNQLSIRDLTNLIAI